MTNRIKPYYDLVKAVLAMSVRDHKPMHGVVKQFWEDAYFTLKEMYMDSSECEAASRQGISIGRRLYEDKH